MENSATDTARDEKTDEMRAQVIVKMIRREARLREIVEQSALGFFIGDLSLSGILRSLGFLAVIIIYIRSDAFGYSGLWPLFAIVAFLEAYRANRRIDAMLELEVIAEHNYEAKTEQSAARSETAS